jgi:hypothetical protein
MAIELSYKIDPDEHGVFDGRDLARQLIGDAYRLLVPYVNARPACADNLFSVIANGMIDELHQQAQEKGKLPGFFLTTGQDKQERTAAERAHLAAATDATAELLRQGGKQPHRHDQDEEGMTDRPFEIWDSEAIHAIKAMPPITKEGEFTQADIVQIDRLLTACCMVLARKEESEHPKQIKAQLTGLKNGYSCWLDFVERAILTAPLSNEARHEIYGAFCMAKAFLFDIEGHNEPPAAQAE